MGIVTKLQLILSIKSLIKDAIEEKGVEVGNSAFDLYPAKISEIGIEDDMTDTNKVYYIDHTGYIHYKYTLEEFLELEDLPANPSFEGLTPTGWQMSLANAKAFVRANGFGPIIGLTYTTNDGTTRVYINIDDDHLKNVQIYYSGLSSTNKTKLKIDWGDNSEMSQSNATNGSFTHTYAQQGEYIIRYIPEDTTVAYIPSSSGSYSSIFGYYNGSTAYSLSKLITKIEYGGNVSGVLGYITLARCESISLPFGCYVGRIGPSSLTLKYFFPSGTGYSGTAMAAPGRIKTLIYPEGITTTPSHSTYLNLNRIILPSTVTTIGVFSYCYNLLAINIPSGVTTLPNSCFLLCYNLTKMVIPNTVTSLGTNCFLYCINLTNITLSSALTTINNYAFSYCYELTNISLPNTLTTLGTYTFLSCYKLVGPISIPSSVTSIPRNCFSSCSTLSGVTFPNTITSIGLEAFSYCYGLTSITLPTSLTSIGSSAFSDCYNLSGTLNIPEGVTTIGSSAFDYCTFKLTEIIIPSTITNIGNYAFRADLRYNSYSVPNKIVHVKAVVPPTAGTAIFNTLASTNGKYIIYVPTESVDAYKTATNWATYASIIEAEPEESD